MTAQEVLNQYVTFLWEQFQYDWSWMSNPWVLYTIFPEIAYIIFFLCKWTILLVPITMPVMIAVWPKGRLRPKDQLNNNLINN